MARQLLDMAARGSDNSTSTSATLATLQTDIQALLKQMESANTAVNVLRAAALLSMRHKAGYIPACDPRPLNTVLVSDDFDTHQAYTIGIIKHLKVIHWQSYQPAYHEWLHWVALTDVPIPPEALPLMLSLATRYPTTRGLTKRLIGSRGRWLSDYSGNRTWYWLKYTKPDRRPRLTMYEKLEARVMQSIDEVNRQRIPLEAVYNLQRMTFPWSNRLSQKIAQTLEIYLSQNRGLSADDLNKLIDLFQWSLNTSQNNTVLKIFKAYIHEEHITPAYAEAYHNLKDVLNFRAELTATFQGMSA